MWPLLYVSDFVDHIFAHPAHLVIEVVLGLFVIYMIFQKRFKPSKEPKLTEKEIQEIVDDWKPQPLGAPLTSLQRLNVDSSPTITGPPDKYLEVDGKKTLNFGTTNYLGLATDPAVLDAAKKALRKYGCGACGPRGFYGTIDIHLDLEERIAKFMGTEQAIIYSAAFATMASAIPAFAKRDDIIIYDDEINFSLQNGIYLSRSTAIPFKHNNVEDLDRAWAKVVEDDKKFKRPLTRRFLVIEGIYATSGDMAPLDQIMKLKEKYCFRIIIDDSHSIGVYGATGRGTIEHFGIDINEVEIILSSMGTVMSSAGGYCCGSKTVVSHQRLNSSGYVFSAALPPFLAATSISCLDIIDSSPSLMSKLRSNATLFRQKLGHLEGFQVTGKEDSPLIHIRKLIPSYQKEEDRYPTEVLLQKVVDQVREEGVSICRAKYVAKDMCKGPPSLNIYISTFHEPEDIEKAAGLVRKHLLTCFQ